MKIIFGLLLLISLTACSSPDELAPPPPPTPTAAQIPWPTSTVTPVTHSLDHLEGGEGKYVRRPTVEELDQYINDEIPFVRIKDIRHFNWISIILWKTSTSLTGGWRVLTVLEPDGEIIGSSTSGSMNIHVPPIYKGGFSGGVFFEDDHVVVILIVDEELRTNAYEIKICGKDYTEDESRFVGPLPINKNLGGVVVGIDHISSFRIFNSQGEEIYREYPPNDSCQWPKN